MKDGQIQRRNPKELSPANTTEAAIEKVVLKGDLNGLTPVERVQFNFALCRTLGLNPLTHPIDYLESEGKLKIYVNSIGIAQLRAKHGISTAIVRSQKDDEFIYTTARAIDRSGRFEESTAIIPLTDNYGKKLTGKNKANAIMKAETKAKRRATLALCGIPWTDGDNPIKSEFFDPPQDVLPEEPEF
jgi:hypothetical protein